MTLERAADTLAAEIERQADREHALGEDLKATRARRASLTRAVWTLLGDLEPGTRRTVELRLAAALERVDAVPRRGGPSSDKVDAVMDYAARSTGIVTVPEVQRFLERHGLADYPKAASTMLSRKAKQGFFERIGRGRYRVVQPS